MSILILRNAQPNSRSGRPRRRPGGWIQSRIFRRAGGSHLPWWPTSASSCPTSCNIMKTDCKWTYAHDGQLQSFILYQIIFSFLFLQLLIEKISSFNFLLFFSANSNSLLFFSIFSTSKNLIFLKICFFLDRIAGEFDSLLFISAQIPFIFLSALNSSFSYQY